MQPVPVADYQGPGNCDAGVAVRGLRMGGEELSDRAKLAYCIYLAELYLAGELDLDGLWEKSTERCAWLDSEPNAMAGPLIGFMDGSVWEVRDGIATEDEFRRELAEKLAKAGWRPGGTAWAETDSTTTATQNDAATKWEEATITILGGSDA